MIQGPILIMNLACFAFLYFTTKQAFESSANSLQDAIGSKERMKMLNRKHLVSSVAIIMVLLIQVNFNPGITIYFSEIRDQMPMLFYLFPIASLAVSLMAPIKTGNPSPMPVLISYYLLRTLYLGLYEMYFRLTLPVSISSYSGIIPAIIISTILYGWIHQFSRRTEFYFSFLFGLILNWMVYLTHSIYPAILMHLLLSLPYELRFILPHKTSRL